MTPDDDDDPFEGLDEDLYVPPESDVDPEEHLDAEPEDEPEEEAEPEGEPDEEAPEETPEEEPEVEEEPEPEPAAGGEPGEGPPEIEPDEEGVARIPPPGAAEEAPEEETGFDALDEGQYVPPESDVDPEENLDVDDEPDEEPPPPVAAGPGPGPGAEEEPARERGPEEPPDEDLRIEDVLGQPEEEPLEEEPGPAADEPREPDRGAPEPEPGPEETEEEPARPVAGPPAAEPEEEPADEEPEEAEEPESGEPGEPPTPPGAGPPAGPEARDREPPSLPGVGDVLVAETLDGLGSRRVSWTVAGLAVALLGAAYWRGLSDTAWFLRTAFALTPVLLLPAFLLRFPVERRTGHDRFVGAYPVSRGRYLLGRYLAYVLLGLAYLALAAAVAGPVAYYSGPYWVDQLPYHVGVGALVVLATASLGVLLGPLLGARSSWGTGLLGLVLAGLMYLAPRGIYVVEEYVLTGSLLELASVRLLHLAPPVAATSLLAPPEAFPVLGSSLVEAAILPVLALLFLAVGWIGFARLQGPGGWQTHPGVVAAFAVVVVASLAAPVAFPVDLDRGDPVVVRSRSDAADVTAGAVQDLRGASGGAVDGALTLGVSYDGFLALELVREESGNGTTLTGVGVAVEADVLGVDGEADLGDVSVPASGEDPNRVPVDVGVDVDSVPGALDPAPATAVVEVTSDQADFTLVADDLETATAGNQPVRWFPAAVAVAAVILQGAVLAASRRRL